MYLLPVRLAGLGSVTGQDGLWAMWAPMLVGTLSSSQKSYVGIHCRPAGPAGMFVHTRVEGELAEVRDGCASRVCRGCEPSLVLMETPL